MNLVALTIWLLVMFTAYRAATVAESRAARFVLHVWVAIVAVMIFVSFLLERAD